MSPTAADSDHPTASASSVALPEHCFYCFEVISAALQRGSTPDSDDESDLAERNVDFPNDTEAEEFPLFVTWNIYSSPSALSRALSLGGGGSGARLRGCIGTFEPQPLREGLRTYALTAAFKDRRFSPIASKELQRLECG